MPPYRRRNSAASSRPLPDRNPFPFPRPPPASRRRLGTLRTSHRPLSPLARLAIPAPAGIRAGPNPHPCPPAAPFWTVNRIYRLYRLSGARSRALRRPP